MTFTLNPQTHNGIMIWTPTTLLLHLLWGWQFILVCAGEVFLLMAIAIKGSSVAGSVPEPAGWLWLFFVLNAVLAVLIIGEICLYANAQLSPNLYLGLQAGCLLYATVLFGLYFAFWGSINHEEFWPVVGGIIVYCVPWILSFGLALLIKFSEHGPEKTESLENGNGNGNREAARIRSPERTPLLANQVPSPRLPSQRVAVQRYPS